MVDNRGVSPIPSFNFKSGDASGMANKMSDEKMGQGGEYFAQDMQDEEENLKENIYQDRSAQLRASLDSLAMANAGSIMFTKLLKEKERLKKEDKNPKKSQEENSSERKHSEEEDSSL